MLFCDKSTLMVWNGIKPMKSTCFFTLYFWSPQIPFEPPPMGAAGFDFNNQEILYHGLLRSNHCHEKTTFHFQALRFQSWPSGPVTHLKPLQLWIMNIKTLGILENCFISCKLFTQKWWSIFIYCKIQLNDIAIGYIGWLVDLCVARPLSLWFTYSFT